MKPILLSLGAAALAAALLCSCGPFQVAEKVMDQADLVQIAAGLAMHAENTDHIDEALEAGLVRRTYTAETDVDKIKIQEKHASLRIETGDVDRIQVSYVDYADRQAYKISEGSYTLRITNDSSNTDVTYTTVITLPEKEYTGIEIEADDSTVTVLDVAVDSVWMRRSSNAMVQFSGLTSDQIDATVNNGMVTVSDTAAARLDVSVDNGMVTLEDTQVDRYNCQVENGSIEGTIAGRADEYDIRTSVDMGSNKIPSSSNRLASKRLQLHVGNGTIDVQFAG